MPLKDSVCVERLLSFSICDSLQNSASLFGYPETICVLRISAGEPQQGCRFCHLNRLSSRLCGWSLVVRSFGFVGGLSPSHTSDGLLM